MGGGRTKGILVQIARDLYDQRILGNQYRPHYVERMVGTVLGGGWKVVSANWNGWDLQNVRTRMRIEVKQSAAIQPWTDSERIGGRTTRGSFDVRTPRSYFADNGKVRVPTKVRPADLFIFARHPREGRGADHRVFEQWEFYVLPEHRLPHQDTISLSKVAKLAAEDAINPSREPLSHDRLGAAVRRLVRVLRPFKASKCVKCERRLTRSTDPRGVGACGRCIASFNKAKRRRTR